MADAIEKRGACDKRHGCSSAHGSVKEGRGTWSLAHTAYCKKARASGAANFKLSEQAQSLICMHGRGPAFVIPLSPNRPRVLVKLDPHYRT